MLVTFIEIALNYKICNICQYIRKKLYVIMLCKEFIAVL